MTKEELYSKWRKNVNAEYIIPTLDAYFNDYDNRLLDAIDLLTFNGYFVFEDGELLTKLRDKYPEEFI